MFNKEFIVLYVVRNVRDLMYFFEIVYIILEYIVLGVRLIICVLIIIKDMNYNWSYLFFLYIFINKN